MGLVTVQVYQVEKGETWVAELWLAGSIAGSRFADTREQAGLKGCAMLRELAEMMDKAARDIEARKLWERDFEGLLEDC